MIIIQITNGALSEAGIIPANAGEAVVDGQLENAILVKGRIAITANNAIVAVFRVYTVEGEDFIREDARYVSLIHKHGVDFVAVLVGRLYDASLRS